MFETLRVIVFGTDKYKAQADNALANAVEITRVTDANLKAFEDWQVQAAEAFGSFKIEV